MPQAMMNDDGSLMTPYKFTCNKYNAKYRQDHDMCLTCQLYKFCAFIRPELHEFMKAVEVRLRDAKEKREMDFPEYLTGLELQDELERNYNALKVVTDPKLILRQALNLAITCMRIYDSIQNFEQHNKK